MPLNSDLRYILDRAVWGFDRARLLLLSLVLVAMPFAVGGGVNWFPAGIGLVNAIGFALLFFELACSGRRIRFHWYWLIAAGLLVLLSVQLFPSHVFTRIFSPKGAEVWARARDAGLTDLPSHLSLAPFRTRQALWIMTQVALTGLLIYNTYTTRSRLLLLLSCVAGAAVANALAALFPVITGSEPLYSEMGISTKPLSGTFLNRNHFGFLMAIGLVSLAGIAWSIYISRPAEAGNGRRIASAERILSRHRGPLLVVVGVAAVAVAMSMLLSLSRGAVAGACVALMCFVWFGLKGDGQTTRWREGLAAAVAFVAVIMFTGIQALMGLWDRYEKLMDLGNLGMLGRWNVWRETVDLIARFPLTGVGLGAFRSASPMVERGFVAGRVSANAHNDYLELLAEMGLPIGLALLALLAAGFVVLWRRALTCRDPFSRTLAVAAVSAMSGAAVHEFVEYNLHARANLFALTALVLLVLLATELGQPGRQANGPDSPRGTRRRSGGATRLGLAGGGLLIAVIGAVLFPPRIAAGFRLDKLRAQLSGDDVKHSGEALKLRARYFVDTAEEVSRILPNNEAALTHQSAHRQILADFAVYEASLAGAATDARQTANRAVLEAREATFRLCRILPCDGFHQASYAKQLNLSAWFEEIDPQRLVIAFETAHRHHPNVAQVTWFCLDGLAQVLEADGEDMAPKEVNRLEALLSSMGGDLLEQQPARAPDVFGKLTKINDDPDKLLGMTPPRLLCQEALYRQFFRQGRYGRCAELLDTMEELNRMRVTRDDRDRISIYELVRTHPASRDEMAAQIARKRMALASLAGDWDELLRLRREHSLARRNVCLERLETARKAARDDNLHRAISLGRRLVATFPELPEPRIVLARWLTTAGHYDDAIAYLQPLMWLEPMDLPILNQAAACLRELPEDHRVADNTTMLSDIITVRMAEAGDRPDRDALMTARERLRSWNPASETGRRHSRFAHLALYYAGRAAEILGEQTLAFEDYVSALGVCPMHRVTVERILELPDGIGEDARRQLREALQVMLLPEAALDRDMMEIAPGFSLKQLTVEPAKLRGSDDVRVSLAVEVRGDVSSLPRLNLSLVHEDGSEIGWALASEKSGWSIKAGHLHQGQLIAAEGSFTPAILALETLLQVLEPGRVRIRLNGAGRDKDLSLWHPGFIITDE